MTATDTTASTLLVAIDISKHRHEVLIGVPGKKRRRRLTLTNTLDDFRRLSGFTEAREPTGCSPFLRSTRHRR